MKLGTVVIYSFILSFIIAIVGSLLMIVREGDPEFLLILAVFFWLVFVVSSIIEVRRSQIPNSEKWMWTLAFIFFSGLAGLIYLLIGRKRIASQSAVTF